MLFLERSVWRKYPWLAVTSLDKMISPFTMVYGPLAILFLSLWERNMFILVAFVCYIIVTRIIKTIMYFTWSRPRPPLKWLLYIGPFIFVQYWGAVIKLYALCTLKDRRWGNREVKVNAQNEIVRTGEFEDSDDKEVEAETIAPAAGPVGTGTRSVPTAKMVNKRRGKKPVRENLYDGEEEKRERIPVGEHPAIAGALSKADAQGAKSVSHRNRLDIAPAFAATSVNA